MSLLKKYSKGLKAMRFLLSCMLVLTLAYIVYNREGFNLEYKYVAFLLNKTKVGDASQIEGNKAGRVLSSFTDQPVTTKFVTCNKSVETPDFRNLKEKWQRMENSSETHHVFSAYYHIVDSVKTIRIIGNIFQPAKTKKVFCLLWYNNSSRLNNIGVATAKVEALPEGHGLRYRVSFFHCDLPDVNIPVAVSLTSQPCQVPINLLPVRSSRPVVVDRYKRKFAVCVPPLFGQYNLTRELIQWIELNRILGADYFVFYNFSTSRETDFILKFYEGKGLVKVVDWNVTAFPTGTRDGMHYFGQHAAMNDCLMRAKSFSEFIVNIDLDEVLIPHDSNCTDWHDMVRLIPNHGGYLFRHSFFRLNWKNTEIDFPRKHVAEKCNVWPLLKLTREARVYGARDRSKYFSWTNVTESVGTHLIFRMKSGYNVHTLSPNEGLVHHYRTRYTIVNGTEVPDPVNNVPSIVDDTAYVKYRDKLLDSVMVIYSEINETEMGKQMTSVETPLR